MSRTRWTPAEESLLYKICRSKGEFFAKKTTAFEARSDHLILSVVTEFNSLRHTVGCNDPSRTIDAVVRRLEQMGVLSGIGQKNEVTGERKLCVNKKADLLLFKPLTTFASELLKY